MEQPVPTVGEVAMETLGQEIVLQLEAVVKAAKERGRKLSRLTLTRRSFEAFSAFCYRAQHNGEAWDESTLYTTYTGIPIRVENV